jgi:Uma2 family endonuclease
MVSPRRQCRRYAYVMPTLVLDPPPQALEALQERRRRAGLDRFDEVWEGVLHMVPAPLGEHADISQQLAEVLGPLARAAGLTATIAEFNLGVADDDFRVPDGGIHRTRPRGVWHTTAALVVEIVSPGDESWQKLPFYAAHQVDEVLIADPADHTVHWLALTDGEYREVRRSGLLDIGPAELAERIDWP